MLNVSDIDAASAERVAAQIRAAGGQAQAHTQDVTDKSRWAELLAAIVTRHGQLDIVVNNAGIVITGSVEDATLDEWRKTQCVNLDAVFLGTREAIRVMKTQGGSIINISSIEGIIGDPITAAYNASKGGVRIFTVGRAALRRRRLQDTGELGAPGIYPDTDGAERAGRDAGGAIRGIRGTRDGGYPGWRHGRAARYRQWRAVFSHPRNRAT